MAAISESPDQYALSTDLANRMRAANPTDDYLTFNQAGDENNDDKAECLRQELLDSEGLNEYDDAVRQVV